MAVKTFKRITVDPKICHGKACIKGTRIPVHIILNLLASGETTEGILKAYPHITKKDVEECIKYGAYLAEEEILPLFMTTAG